MLVANTSTPTFVLQQKLLTPLFRFPYTTPPPIRTRVRICLRSKKGEVMFETVVTQEDSGTNPRTQVHPTPDSYKGSNGEGGGALYASLEFHNDCFRRGGVVGPAKDVVAVHGRHW